jgi:hypothetical protein
VSVSDDFKWSLDYPPLIQRKSILHPPGTTSIHVNKDPPNAYTYYSSLSIRKNLRDKFQGKMLGYAHCVPVRTVKEPKSPLDL